MLFSKNTLSVFVWISLSAIILSCGTNQFRTVNKEYLFDPDKSIAVVSGYNDDNSITFAEMISEKLVAEGRFKVLSQEVISQKIPKYPLNINLIDFSIPDKDQRRNTQFLTQSSKDNIDALQKIVKADYILVVWVDRIVDDNGTLKLFLLSRFIEYPGGDIVGYSNEWNDKSSMVYCSCLRGSWLTLFKHTTSDYVDEIIEITKKQVD